MKFIHNRDKDHIGILNAKHQLILKIIGHPLLFCQQHDGWFVVCGKESIQIKIGSHKNNSASLDVFYHKQHILSFMDETPERPACLSIYEKLPSLLKVPKSSDIQKNKWILMDYRKQVDRSLAPPEMRIQRPKKVKLYVPPLNKKARFREL